MRLLSVPGFVDTVTLPFAMVLRLGKRPPPEGGMEAWGTFSPVPLSFAFRDCVIAIFGGEGEGLGVRARDCSLLFASPCSF